MITDKDREEANIIIGQAYSEFSSTLSERLGIDELETIIAGRISYIRYKAAEEAAGIAVKWVNKNLCDEHMPIMYRRMEEELRAAILKEATE